MKVILYEKNKSPRITEATVKDLEDFIGGDFNIIELINGNCFVWNEHLPIPKTRSMWHRNIFITQGDSFGKIKSIPMQIYGNFFICGYEDKKTCDIPENTIEETMAMFGF